MIRLEQQKTQRKIAEEVAGKKVINGKTHYYVVWKGEPKTSGDWLPITRLTKAYKLIRDYQKRYRLFKRRQLQRRKLLRQQRNKQKSTNENVEELSVKLNTTKLDHSGPIYVPPEDCICLLSESSAQNEEIMDIQEQKVLVSKFDCIKGFWANQQHTLSQLDQLNQLRQRFAWRHQTEAAVIKNIVNINDQLVVQYVRKGIKYQCLLNNFKSYLPQMLVKFILRQYDPVYNEVKQPLPPHEMPSQYLIQEQ